MPPEQSRGEGQRLRHVPGAGSSAAASPSGAAVPAEAERGAGRAAAAGSSRQPERAAYCPMAAAARRARAGGTRK